MIKIVFEKLHKDAAIPVFAHEGDAGADVVAVEDCIVRPRCTARVQTGLRLQIPSGHEVQVRPRSGLSSKGVFTAFGTVDCKYRGEVGVVMYNSSDEAVTVKKGDRIAQFVVKPIYDTEYIEGKVDTNTVRGENGFGSTGVTSAELFKGIFEGNVDPSICNLDPTN